MSNPGRRMGWGGWGIREEKRGTPGGKGLWRGPDRSGMAAATPEHPLPGVSWPSPRLGAGEPGVQERKMHKANIFDVAVNVF